MDGLPLVGRFDEIVGSLTEAGHELLEGGIELGEYGFTYFPSLGIMIGRENPELDPQKVDTVAAWGPSYWESQRGPSPRTSARSRPRQRCFGAVELSILCPRLRADDPHTRKAIPERAVLSVEEGRCCIRSLEGDHGAAVRLRPHAAEWRGECPDQIVGPEGARERPGDPDRGAA